MEVVLVCVQEEGGDDADADAEHPRNSVVTT